MGYFAGFPCEHSFFVKLYGVAGIILLVGIVLGIFVYGKFSKVLAGVIILATLTGAGLWLWEDTPGQCVSQVPIDKLLKDIRD
jgi:hypothetical protein